MGANLSFHYCYCIPYQISRIRILAKLVAIILSALVLCFIHSCGTNPDDERHSGFKDTAYKADDLPKYGTITLEFEEEFVLGDDPDGRDFVSRYDIEVDSKGTIYVLDGTMKEIVVFDSTGQRIRTIGREGQGPGEFMQPSRTTLVSDDELYVKESYRIHSFHSDGSLRFTQRNEDLLTQFQALKNGGRFGVFGKRIEDRRIEKLAVLDSLNHGMKDIYEMPTSYKARMDADDDSGSHFTLTVHHSYVPELLLAALQPDQLIYANSLEYALYVLDKNGNTQKIIRRNVQKEPISSEEKEAIIQYHLQGSTAQQYRRDFFVNAVKFPDHRPFIRKIITDNRGLIYVIWVDSIFDEYQSPYFKLDIFNSEGTYLYHALSLFLPHVIKNGKAYGKTWNRELESPTVACMRFKNWSTLNRA